MSVKTSNAYGNISISDMAIAKVASQAALECYGIVETVSRRFTDSLSELFNKKTQGRGVKVTTSGGQDLYRRVRHYKIRSLHQRRRRIFERERQIQSREIYGYDS